MTRAEQVQALMEEVRDALQQVIKDSPFMQQLSAKGQQMQVQCALGITIFVRNMGGEEFQIVPTEGQPFAVPTMNVESVTQRADEWEIFLQQIGANTPPDDERQP